MRRRVASGPVLDQNSLDAFAGNSRQSVLVDKRYFGILRVGKPDRVANGFIGSDVSRGHQGQGGQCAHRHLHGFLTSSGRGVANSRRELSSDPIGELDSVKLIGVDGSVVTHQPRITSDDFVEGRPRGSRDFDRGVARCRECGVRYNGCDVICGDRLKQAGRDVDDAVLLARIGNASEELHELRRANDRVRDA